MRTPGLRSGYDALLLDLDGTLYRGPDEIPGARDAVVGGDERLLYVTNNASRAPETVAGQLVSLGFPAQPADVVTSAQVAAAMLAERVPAGTAVLVVGAEALAAEIDAVGLVPVRSFDDGPGAVVQGHSPDTGWRILAEATLAIRAGALWVATNVDSTLPTERGVVLGNGSMVAAVSSATGARPLVAGKPATPIMTEAVRRAGATRPLVVGDRLDTDIAGACAADMDSLLVLTGVSTLGDLLSASPSERPTHLAATLEALDASAESSRIGAGDGIDVQVRDGEIVVSASRDVDDVALVRAIVPALWEHGVGTPVRGEGAASTAGEVVARLFA
ncbi:HAD-IIA family hydrolase [Rhodococcus rhodnii]|uniref:HAD-IIA family hydrolase n=2 Tax=Rhodococcus rhodnii TaxID=38312 RepID=A0A6P2CET5_9NOCA|nr:HAD-IIA family hydrolase [Rhodococcus rhodnii]EOM78477.1 putative haloacid dehalogenase-like hydrolase [Rhodococcus rhodnii LMG 5362]TXG91277.1 HAD-IIA family hydrolase [Rhodococcus rhodnii]